MDAELRGYSCNVSFDKGSNLITIPGDAAGAFLAYFVNSLLHQINRLVRAKTLRRVFRGELFGSFNSTRV
jgi:hypothetical protein